MGHQVNFYLDPSDTVTVEHAVRSIEPLFVLHSRSQGPTPKVLDSFNVEDEGKPWLFLYLVRPEDLNQVVTSHISAQGYWSVEVLESPVIELTRCFFDGSVLRRGRLYYVDGFYDTDQCWREKPEGFRRWARDVLKKTKRVLKKHQSDYIGSGAEAWLSTCGGRLLT